MQVTDFNAAKYFTKSWKKGGTEISTADELGISAIDSDVGSYQLELYRDYYTITDDWDISIVSLPVVSLQPEDTLSAVDESAYFETAGAGGSTYTYQWGQVFANYANKTTEDGLGHNYCAAACESNGVVYVATAGGVSISANGGSGTFVNKTTANGLGSNSCWGVSESDGVLCVATTSGLGISTDGGSAFVNKTTTVGLGHNSIKDVFVTKGVIYAATYGGFSFSTDGGDSFVNKTTADGLGHDHTWCVYVNSSGNIYVGTEAGISISTDGGTSFSNYDEANNNLGNNHCRGVFELNGTIYVATSGGGLSMSTDGGVNFVNKTVDDNDLGSNACSGVFVSDGTIYVATSGGLSISTDGGTSFVNKTTTDGLGSISVKSAFVSGYAEYIGTAGGLSISPLWDEIVGETTASMDLTTTSEMDNAYYSGQITNSSTGCINYSDTVQLFVVNSWNGSTDTDWNTTENWAEGALPTLTDTIIIRDVTNKPIISATGTASCNKLIINSGTTLKIESTASGTGSLITNGAVTNNGTFTVERFFTDASWHFVTPSTTGVTANDFYWDDAPVCWLTSHNETNNLWTYNTNLSTSMPVGQGWSVWIDDATKSSATTTMTGDMQTTDLTVNLTKNGLGWNLIGNPFTSAADWGEGSWGTNTTGTVYVWDNDFNSGDYRTWNGSTGDLTGGIIPVSQGFFVQANTAGSFTIPAGSRVHSSTSFYKSTNEDDSPYLRIHMDYEDHGNTVFVGFPENGTSYFDYKGDATKLYSNDEFPQIYVVEDGIKLSTNALTPLNGESKTVPLHLDQVVDGEYTFTITNLDNLPDMSISLEDLQTGTIHDFIKNPIYSFSASSGDEVNRFILHFKSTTFGINEDMVKKNELMNIYSANNNIYIRSKGEAVNEIGNIEVYSLNGQKLLEQRINTGSLIVISVIGSNNYLIVRVKKPSGTIVKKLFTK